MYQTAKKRAADWVGGQDTKARKWIQSKNPKTERGRWRFRARKDREKEKGDLQTARYKLVEIFGTINGIRGFEVLIHLKPIISVRLSS